MRRAQRTRCCRPPRAAAAAAPLAPERVEGLGAALPVLVDLHEQLQVGALGKLLAHGGADLLQDLPPLADDDALLRLALDEDLAADAWPLPLCYPTRQRVRQLFSGDGEQLLTHELGDPKGLWHVGDHVVGVVERSLGEAGDDRIDELIHTLARARRHGEVFGELELPCPVQLGEDLGARGGVDLVDHDQRVLRYPRGDEPVAGPDGSRGVEHEAHDVNVAERRLRGVVEPLAEERAGPVDARGIDEHDLRVRPCEDAAHLRSRRLQLVRDDRDLRAEDAVEQRGLADVRPPDQRGEPRSHSLSRSRCGWNDARREMRTRPMRRPCTFSARRRWPLKSTVSPSVGTCPRRLKNRPATVSQSPSGKSAWVSSLTSSMGMRPFTRTSPPGNGSMFGSSTSNSSTISPTSSSIRSSSVTNPAVPPYSSTTIAMWNLSFCISRMSSETRLVSGTKWAGRTNSRTTRSPASSPARNRSFTYTMPTMSSMFCSYAGMRLYPAAIAISRTSRTGVLPATVTMSGR